MKAFTQVLLAGALLAALVSCGRGDAPVSLKIVPNPVSLQYSGRGVKMPVDGTVPKVTTRLDPKLAAEEYVLDTRKGKVVLTGGSEAGIYWGQQTFAQILAQGLLLYQHLS